MANMKAPLPRAVASALRTLKYGSMLVSCYLYDLSRTWRWTSAVACDTDRNSEP